MGKKIKVEVEIPEGYDLVINGTDCKLVPKSKLPKTWEEFCKMNSVENKERFIRSNSEIDSFMGGRGRDVEKDRNFLPNERLAEAVLALCQLLQLRDCYNGSWIPEWTDIHECKYIIISFGYEIVGDESNCKSHPLSFKSEKLRDEFLKNFRDLIEIAKPLI